MLRERLEKSAYRLPIYLGLVVLVFLATGLLISDLFLQYRDKILVQAENDTMNLARVLDERLVQTFKRLDADLQRIVGGLGEAEMSPGQAARHRERMTKMLSGIKLNFPEVDHAFVFDARGDLLYASNPLVSQLNASMRQHFIRLRDDPAAELVFSEVFTARTTGQQTLVVARPVRDARGGFLGIVSVLLELQEFKRLFASLQIGRQGVIAIRTNDELRLILRHPERPDEINKSIVASPIRQRISAGEVRGSMRFASLIDGVPRIWSFRVLQNYPFTIMVAFSEEEVLAAWREKLLYSGWALVLMGLLLAGAMGRALSSDRRRQQLVLELVDSQGALREKQRQLHETARLHDAIEESITESIWLLTAEGVVLTANSTATQRLGVALAALQGRDIFDFFPEEIGEVRRRTLRQVVVSKQRQVQEDRRAGRDFLNVFYPVLDDGGRCDHVVVVATDVTQKKAHEAELADYRDHLEQLVGQRTADLEIAKEAAEAANRAKTAFLSMASHELRTPMNGVMGTIGLAMRKTDDPVLLGYLSKADRASRQLLGIINNVLDISRIESDRLTLAASAFTLGEIRHHVLDAVGSLAEAKHLELAYPVEAALEGERFIGDPMRLAQVLINLVGNALKFTSAGQVRVGVGALPGATAETMRLRFEVSDTGIGIRDADRERIFEPFEQADASVTRKHGGTGLGLSLCRKLVEMMAGSIGVDSEPGRGSRFWFEIEVGRLSTPADTAQADVPSAEKPASGDVLKERHHGASVLVAEDEPLNQEIIRAVLEEVGLNVFTVSDGQEAVEFARSGVFDLILMDINMPRMSGIEATCEIRRLASHVHTPIIALTANAFAEDRNACIQAGMNDHVGKPVMPEVLYETILHWLDRTLHRARPH